MAREKQKSYQRKKIERKIEVLVKKLIKKLKIRKLFLGVMESCTGGGLANAITNVAGASEIFKGSIVAYSKEVKVNQGVSLTTIKRYSVYSPEVALAMAKAARKNLKSDIGVGITGSISRKDPKEEKSRAGEIFIAVVFGNKILVRRFLFPNKKRPIVKVMVVYQVLRMIREITN